MQIDTERRANQKYASAIKACKRARWDIHDDVIRGRTFDTTTKFLPDGLSFTPRMTTLSPDEKRYMSQIQGRTYANIFGLVERFINAKVLELGADFGDQIAFEGLVRFSDEELKHQELFRLIERLAAADMPPGYCFVPRPNDVAAVVLGKSTWAVLALLGARARRLLQGPLRSRKTLYEAETAWARRPRRAVLAETVNTLQAPTTFTLAV